MITCFDIGGSFIRHGTLREDGSVIENGRVATPGADWEAFVSAIHSCAESASTPISISLAGAFDERSGIADVANIPCLHRRPVLSDLERALGRPVVITNDANAFALAEAVDGSGRGRSVVFGIILGSGVGGGLVIDGKLVKGFGGIAGEWGHGPVLDPTAGGQLKGIGHYACGCGQIGCIDAVCSARGLERIHQSLHGITASSKEITEAWHQADVKAASTIDAYSTLLSRALSVLVNTLGPDVIPVSGGLSNDTTLLDLIDRKTREIVLAKYDQALVLKGHFAENGGLQGAGIVARMSFREWAA
ncbi:N-acetyl-D-glucosamine kinase [Labrenzia sp. THAF82]|uniref:ROK family protein n=1 Tax=Labrenzia sp. THAF82 TaxID=2587861 RepID=UPI0012686DE7|nr:ROK family protein [Labrenzia sp. THAF82]QFT32375.1 N-acetyl-D-glucosamine kinase [Labrenzia sp. THAF82]